MPTVPPIVPRRIAALGLAALLTVPSAADAAAPALADRVPADAVAYFGWAGTATLTDDYRASTLREVLEQFTQPSPGPPGLPPAPTLPPPLGDLLRPLVGPHADDLIDVSRRGAFAAYLTADPDAAPPALRPVLLWRPDSADDRKALIAALKAVPARGPAPPRLVVDGPVVALDLSPDPDPPLDPPAALADAPAFRAALAPLGETGPLIAYLDTGRLLAWVDADAETAPGDAPSWSALLSPDPLGPLVATAGFDGRAWRTRAHLAAPTPRRGLLGLLDTPALTADDLARPPRDTPWFAAVSLDPTLLIDRVREATQEAGPAVNDRFEAGLADASARLGVNLEEDLVRGLGPAWLLYPDPDALGPGPDSLTLVNPLRQPDGVRRGLHALSLAAQRNARSTPPDTTRHGLAAEREALSPAGVETTRLNPIDPRLASLGAPCWAVPDDRLVIARHPAAVAAAADRPDRPGSVMLHDDLIELRERIGTRRLTALFWADLPATAGRAYPRLHRRLQPHLPPDTTFPPLGRLRPLLEPAHAFTWVDDTGWHLEAHTPFPAAALLGPLGQALPE
ncbi:MAG: hypothetical protein AAF710_04035 [Planctomycetota bacterium]